MTSVASLHDRLDLAGLDDLLSEEERAIRDAVRELCARRIDPFVADWFERGEIDDPRGLTRELGAMGLLGMHLTGYGCAGMSAVDYGLACLELEASDSGVRSLVSVQGSLAMYAIWRWGTEEQKTEWLPRMATTRGTCAPMPGGTATTGSSMAPRCGSPMGRSPTSPWCGPRPTKASVASPFRPTHPGSRRR